MQIFWNLFKSRLPYSHAPYVGIPDTAFDEKLKREIQKVEAYAEE